MTINQAANGVHIDAADGIDTRAANGAQSPAANGARIAAARSVDIELTHGQQFAARDADGLERRAAALLAGERDAIANAANLSALIFGALADINWAGFYFVRGDELVLGPFQGQPACVRIARGAGVCGTARRSGEPSSSPTCTPSPATSLAIPRPGLRSSSRSSAPTTSSACWTSIARSTTASPTRTGH